MYQCLKAFLSPFLYEPWKHMFISQQAWLSPSSFQERHKAAAFCTLAKGEKGNKGDRGQRKALIRERETFDEKIMKHKDNVRGSSYRENTKSKAKERWGENADERLRGRESKMKQKGVSANFHNVTLMKPFMIIDRNSQKCSLAGSLHTYILISWNTLPASIEVETFLLVLHALNLGYPCAPPSSMEHYHWGLLWKDWHIDSKPMLPPESVTALCWNCFSGEAGSEIHYVLPKQWSYHLCGTLWDLDIGWFLTRARQKRELIQPVCWMQNTMESNEILGYLKQRQIHKSLWP